MGLQLKNLQSEFCSWGGRFDITGKRRRLEEITHLESQPEFWNDNQKATKIQKEKNQIEALASPFLKVHGLVEDLKALHQLCTELGEVDASSHQEFSKGFEGAESILRTLELGRMLSGENDAGNCYLTVHAGAGGTESCDWAAMLARMYQRYAQKQNFKTEVIDFTDGDSAGYRSITFEISGVNAYGFLKAEVGVHRLVRISPFDSNARRHTSFASVYVYPVIDDDIEVELKMEDVRVDTYRAGGAGGQHVNKTDSAVRMTHGPTGIVVQCQAERSQIQNREKAVKMLKARLYELELQKRQAEADKTNATKKSISWGSQIRNYVLQPYQLIKDTRTQYESSNVDKVLDGDIQEFIESFLLHGGEATPQTEDDLSI